MRTQILSPAIALLLASSLTNADWTRFRGPNGAGFDAGTQPPTVWNETQNVQWKTALPGLGTASSQRRWGSASSPILYKDYVIVNASEEGRAIVALDKKTGKEAWRATGDALEYSFGTPALIESEGRTDLVFAVPDELWGL